jgi:hypothetical protein
MSVAFHRMIMPDGYSVDLDQLHGLDQIGEEGLKDKVNNHYLEIFGTSIALGVIAGAGEITQAGGTISTSGQPAFASGAASSVSQSATSILYHLLGRLARRGRCLPRSRNRRLTSRYAPMAHRRWSYRSHRRQVKQEFAAIDKAKKTALPATKSSKKAA